MKISKVWNDCPICGAEMRLGNRNIECSISPFHYYVFVDRDFIIQWEVFCLEINGMQHFFERNYGDNFYLRGNNNIKTTLLGSNMNFPLNKNKLKITLMLS